MSFTPRQFDLVDLRSRFPETVARISVLDNGESHLRRIHEIEQRWQKARSAPEETPETIEFIDRTLGSSTVTWREILASVRGVISLLSTAHRH